jgi:DNA replication protein DnaC
MSDTLVLERLQNNLSRLRLPRIGSLLPDMVTAAQEQNKSYLAFLDELLEEEVAQKEQRRIETLLRLSGLPFTKTIDEFDFSFQPKLDRQQVMTLFDLDFVRRKENVIFLGPPGVGKTHLAVALAVKACSGSKSRQRGYFRSVLVIVDEVGYTPVSREECHLFFRFISNRYERASTLITSNKSFTDWAELFHDPVIVTAILDRLLHHSIVINIKGNSYRLRDKLGKEVEPVNPKSV